MSLPLRCPAWLVLALLVAAPAIRAETIELKTGTVLQGEIVEIEKDQIILAIDGATMVLKLSDIAPYQAYRLRGKRVKENDASGRLALAEFCRENQLWPQARAEYERALALDSGLENRIKPALEQVALGEADAWLQRGKTALGENRLDDALKQFQMLLSRYPDLAQAGEAKSLMSETTAALKKRNEEKEQQLRAVQERKGGKGEDALAARFQDVVRLIEEGKKANAEGLDAEGATKTSRAQRAYEKAVASFREAREIVAEILRSSKDVDLLAAAKEKAPELDRWLVIGYDNLGHLWAIEFNFREALKWLNKALAIDPNDKFALELKLKMAQQHIGRNARGYLPPDGIDTGGPIR